MRAVRIAEPISTEMQKRPRSAFPLIGAAP